MADDLIDRLAADLRPVSPRRTERLIAAGLLVGLLAAAALMMPWLGLRPDMARAVLTPIFWGKFAFTVAMVATGFLAASRLSRPGGRLREAATIAVAIVAVTGVMGIVQMLLSPPEAARTLLLGGSALLCPFYIVALAGPVYVVAVLVMRRLAPTNLPAAGFAAGLLAGAGGCFVYAFHCTESGMPFITLWYTAGILASALLGALFGRLALRW